MSHQTKPTGKAQPDERFSLHATEHSALVFAQRHERASGCRVRVFYDLALEKTGLPWVAECYA